MAINVLTLSAYNNNNPWNGAHASAGLFFCCPWAPLISQFPPPRREQEQRNARTWECRDSSMEERLQEAMITRSLLRRMVTTTETLSNATIKLKLTSNMTAAGDMATKDLTSNAVGGRGQVFSTRRA